MRGTLSFHPVDLGFFDGVVAPLLRGDKINPQGFLDRALALRRARHESYRYVAALELELEALHPMPPDPSGTLWNRLRQRLDALAYRPHPLSRRVAELLEPDLHLHGRPFLITEGSADHVADVVDDYRNAATAEDAAALVREQLIRLDAELARRIEPVHGDGAPADGHYRAQALAELRELYDRGAAGRDARAAAAGGLCWHAVAAHARAMPYWVAQDVDGLVTICRAAGLEPPEFLGSPARLVAGAREALPGCEPGGLREVRGGRDLGAFVGPERVPDLLDFLSAHGSEIIRVAARHREGAACAVLLRKIRECACYAARHGLGFLEASGIPADDP